MKREHRCFKLAEQNVMNFPNETRAIWYEGSCWIELSNVRGQYCITPLNDPNPTKLVYSPKCPYCGEVLDEYRY